jgi:hypothetical protein
LRATVRRTPVASTSVTWKSVIQSSVPVIFSPDFWVIVTVLASRSGPGVN